MAQPPLAHQLGIAAQIHLARRKGASFVIDETLKGGAPAGSITSDIRIFELLGLAPADGEQAVLFLTVAGQLIEVLAVRDGKVVYARDDASVRRELTLDELRREAKG